MLYVALQSGANRLARNATWALIQARPTSAIHCAHKIKGRSSEPRGPCTYLRRSRDPSYSGRETQRTSHAIKSLRHTANSASASPLCTAHSGKLPTTKWSLSLLSDAELIRYGKAARSLCRDARGYTEFKGQLDEARAEWRRRHPRC